MLLIGAAPPQALRDWRYPVTAFAAGLLTFGFYAALRRVPGPVLIVLDAGGLAMFAIAGAEKSLSLGTNGLAAVLMGGLTGVGGGVIRDILLNTVPSVLRTDIYATAALAGARDPGGEPKSGIAAPLGRRAGPGLVFRHAPDSGLAAPEPAPGRLKPPAPRAGSTCSGVAAHIHRRGIIHPRRPSG